MKINCFYFYIDFVCLKCSFKIDHYSNQIYLHVITIRFSSLSSLATCWLSIRQVLRCSSILFEFLAEKVLEMPFLIEIPVFEYWIKMENFYVSWPRLFCTLSCSILLLPMPRQTFIKNSKVFCVSSKYKMWRFS